MRSYTEEEGTVSVCLQHNGYTAHCLPGGRRAVALSGWVSTRTRRAVRGSARGGRQAPEKAASAQCVFTYLALALPAGHAGGRDAPPLLRVLALGVPLCPSRLLWRRACSPGRRLGGVGGVHGRLRNGRAEMQDVGWRAGRRQVTEQSSAVASSQRSLNQRPASVSVRG